MYTVESSIAKLQAFMLQDPGNLEGDLQAGAAAGYTLLWVLVWSTVMVSFLRLALDTPSPGWRAF